VRHRESWAEERKAPSPEFWQRVLAGEEVFPPRPVKEKPEEAPKPATGGSPKVVLRRKS
jgi:hypothetical protein